MAGGHGGGGEERWLLTYADLITLLLAYFIVMFAISQTDLEKFKKLSASVRQAFHNPILVSIFEGSGGGGTGFFGGLPSGNRDFVRISSDLARLAQAQGLEGQISVNTQREGIVVSISNSVLFGAGSARIRPESRATLDVIAGLLRDMPNEVRVAGHTDDVSPFPEWPSNWELSAARAVQTVKYLSTQGGLDPRRLSAIGHAEYQPLYPNDTLEHRQQNRRVDILIVYETADQAVFEPFGSASSDEDRRRPFEGLETSDGTPTVPARE